MESSEQIKQRLVNDGFSILHEYNDPPKEFFPEHSHPGDQLMVVVSGSIGINMDGETRTLAAGDEMFFPAGTPHAATVGPNGCVYIDGERPMTA